MKIFCVVISAQRTGSTLLCTDVASLQSLGNPKEYSLKLLKEEASYKLSIESYNSMLETSRSNINGNEIYAQKLMVSWGQKCIDPVLPGLYSEIEPDKSPENCAEYFTRYVNYLETNYDKAIVFVNTRKDILGCAHSRVNARKSKYFHQKTSNEQKKHVHIENTKLFAEMLGTLKKAILDYETLQILKDKLKSRSNVLCTDYSDLIELETWQAKLFNFIDTNGIAHPSKIDRTLEKVIDKSAQVKQCREFKAWLNNYLALADCQQIASDD